MYCSFTRFIIPSCEHPYLECYVTILSTPEELSIPVDSLAYNSRIEYRNYYITCLTKQIDNLSNSNDAIDEPTDSDASDHDNGSTNNPEDNTFDNQHLHITDTSADTTQSMRDLSLDGIKIVH